MTALPDENLLLQRYSVALFRQSKTFFQVLPVTEATIRKSGTVYCAASYLEKQRYWLSYN